MSLCEFGKEPPQTTWICNVWTVDSRDQRRPAFEMLMMDGGELQIVVTWEYNMASSTPDEADWDVHGRVCFANSVFGLNGNQQSHQKP